MSVKLSQKLFTRCYKTLLECEEFDEYKDLRTLFDVIDELWPFRYGIQSTDNSQKLVDKCISLLLSNTSKSGHPLLLFFLEVLRDRRMEGDIMREELANLCDEIHDSISSEACLKGNSLQKIQKLIYQIDFTEHIKIVRNTINSSPIAAFLIHGKPQFGQNVLLERLIRINKKWKNGIFIPFDMGARGIGKNSQALWNHLNRKLKISIRNEPDPKLIAQKVCKWWISQDVIFVIDNVDCMVPELFSELVQDFWGRIVIEADQLVNKPNKHLLMFIVDYCGCTCEWPKMKISNVSDLNNFPYYPLQLPQNDLFNETELDYWINSIAAEELPSYLTANRLIKDTFGGVPEMVYETICNLLGFNWEG